MVFDYSIFIMTITFLERSLGVDLTVHFRVRDQQSELKNALNDVLIKKNLGEVTRECIVQNSIGEFKCYNIEICMNNDSLDTVESLADIIINFIGISSNMFMISHISDCVDNSQKSNCSTIKTTFMTFCN